MQDMPAGRPAPTVPDKKQPATERKAHSSLLLQKKTKPFALRKSAKKLTKLQMQVLNAITHHSRSANFLSLRDLERMLPNRRYEIDHSLIRLLHLGLAKCVKAKQTIHYCPTKKLKSLKKQVSIIATYDKIEEEIIQTVRESLMRLYPAAVSSSSDKFIVSNESTYFDIVFKFKSRVMDKQFLAADVFAKIPVTKQIVQSFSKKLRWDCSDSKSSVDADNNSCYTPREKTLGVIICNKASRKAVDMAENCDISLLNFRDTQLCYSQLGKLNNSLQIAN
jgi:hypothetical protein